MICVCVWGERNIPEKPLSIRSLLPHAPGFTYNLLLGPFQRLRIAAGATRMRRQIDDRAHAAQTLHRNGHVAHTLAYDLANRLQERVAEVGGAVGQHVHLLGATLQLRAQMDQLPQEVRVHVLGRRGAHLHLGDGYQHLVADDLHLVGGVLAGHAHQFLLLAQALFAQEHNGRFEHEAHGVQLQALFDLAQKIGDVQPLDAAVVQQIAGVQETHC